MTMRREYGLIPAAGKSRRMGRPKLALPLGDATVLEHVVRLLRPPTLTDVLVVLGPHVAELATQADRAGARTLVLAAETADMRETIERGLDWIEETHHPSDADYLVLLPADHPCLDVRVLEIIRASITEHPTRTIFIPTFDRKRGHPVFLQWRHVAAIRSWPRDQGLNTYLRARASETVEVATNLPSVILDLDTPEDYQRMLKEW